MLTVKIFFLNGETDLKDVWNVADICLDGVKELKIIRDERSLQ